jgi:type IV secretion system protein VirD4
MLLATGVSGVVGSAIAFVVLHEVAVSNSEFRGDALEEIAHYSPAGFVICVLVALLAGVTLIIALALKAKKENDRDPATFHGTARFATTDELKKLKLPTRDFLTPGGVIIAPEEAGDARGLVALPRMLAVQHGIILGGTGTGKSRGYFLPNCAWSVETSIVCTDPKSELWKYTSGFHTRERRYAPADPEASECFNWIPLCRDARIAELAARAIMESGSFGDNQFWIDTESAYLAAIFAHTATLPEPTPLTAYRLFTRQRPAQLLDQLLNSPSDVAREQAIVFAQTDAKIKGSIVPAVAGKLQFMRDPNVARFTSASLVAPNFGSLRRTPQAVYWCLREQDIARLRPLTSLFFAVLLEQIAGEEIPEGEPSTPITMLMDEFANVGTIPDFATTISLARGRGVGIWLGVQSLSQLEARYGRPNAQTILTNCNTKIALHGLDVTTAKYVSEMLGDATVVAERKHESFSIAGGWGTSKHRTEHRRPLLTPDEVMRLGEDEALVRTSNQHPMRLAKMYYDEPPRAAIASALGQVRALELTPVTPPPIEEPPKLPELIN